MKNRISPASIISIVGGVLAIIGLASYFTNTANLSVPTFFYGVPILLIGLALKNSELDPARSNISSSELKQLKAKGPEELVNLIGDVSRYRYGQRAHLESSLKVLKLWDESNPPQLRDISIIDSDGKYGIQMKFELRGVPLDKWQQQQDRLGRFFAKDFLAEIISNNEGEVELKLLPKNSSENL